SRLFRKQVGMPVSNYLRQTRIQHACRLLQLGRLDVTAVGLEVGYEDKSNFGRAFRKVMKMSPGQYRQKIVGQ
ncbi:MAG TPA: AraC family transcriptional regulator, partial [Phycisphaerales bacterium]|nr:AraC family transcriptional regulator [Phycisphaerales bacterium]